MHPTLKITISYWNLDFLFIELMRKGKIVVFSDEKLESFPVVSQ